MLNKKLYDYDFMGGIVAMYLKNKDNGSIELDSYFGSEEAKGVWGYFGKNLYELRNRIYSPEAEMVYYIRSKKNKEFLLKEASKLPEKSYKAFMFFYNSDSFLDAVSKSNYDSITGLFAGAYYGVDQVLVSKVMISISQENREKVGYFKEICLASYNANEGIKYFPFCDSINGYCLYFLDVNDEYFKDKINVIPSLNDVITFENKILIYMYDGKLTDSLDLVGSKLSDVLEEYQMKEINVINKYNFKDVDLFLKKYVDNKLIKCYIPLTELELKAYELMFKYHFGQKDKAGIDYFHHPFFVGIHCNNDKARIVGFLHDTLEDTSISLEEIEEFGDEIADAVKILTHNDDTSYMDYVKRINTNPIAKEVKLADLLHNTNLGRDLHPDVKMFKRLVLKYDAALNYLNNN